MLAAIERWRPEAVFGFAVTWAGLARFDLAQRDLDSVRLWFNTGDCAHEAHIRRLVAVGSPRGRHPRGPSRGCRARTSSTGSAPPRWGTTASTSRTPPTRDRYGRCIGRPYSFAEAAVLDDDGAELPAGQVGRLGFRSPSLSPGYWNDSVTTYRARVNGWFLTGDLVYRDEEGYYYHVDRARDAVADGRASTRRCPRSGSSPPCPDVLDCTVVITDEDGRRAHRGPARARRARTPTSTAPRRSARRSASRSAPRSPGQRGRPGRASR